MIKKPIVCVGAALIDECFTSLEKPVSGTSNPSTYFRSSGGVACNISHHLSLLGQNVELVTHFGNDTDGRWLMERCKSNAIGISNSIVNEKETGRYAAFLSPTGELFAGAMSGNLETEITIDFLKEKIQLLKSASLLLIDCNLNEKCIGWLIEFSNKENISCIIEPVSVPKARKLQHTNIRNVLLITPNKEEMSAMCGTSNNENEIKLIRELFSRGVKNIWMRNGKNGSRFYTGDLLHELAAPNVKVTDTTGAGDAALAGWVYAYTENKSPEDCLVYGHAMASINLQVRGAIQNNLTVEMLKRVVEKYK